MCVCFKTALHSPTLVLTWSRQITWEYVLQLCFWWAHAMTCFKTKFVNEYKQLSHHFSTRTVKDQKIKLSKLSTIQIIFCFLPKAAFSIYNKPKTVSFFKNELNIYSFVLLIGLWLLHFVVFFRLCGGKHQTRTRSQLERLYTPLINGILWNSLVKEGNIIYRSTISKQLIQAFITVK